MKTILKDKAYMRVSDEVAEQEVRFGKAKYVSKSEWKSNFRNIKSEEVTIAEQKGEVTKSKKAIKAAKLKEKQRQ